MYKTKETAIKHLESDKFEDFRHKNFNLFRDSEEVALVAIKRNYSAIEGVSERLRNSIEFNRQAFEANSDVYLIQRHKDHLMQDREILKHAAKSERFPYFESQKEDLLNDRELALIAAKANGMCWGPFKEDKEVALAAVNRKGWSLTSVSKELQNDKDVVLAAVKQDPMALMQANSEMKADKEVVREAVQKDPEAIKYADKTIQKLCYNKDAFLTLNSLINMEKLQAQLKPKAPSQTRAMKI